MSERNGQVPSGDGMDRRGLLKCTAWADTGMVRGVSGGLLGQEQLDWLKRDLAGKIDSTPVVIFAHLPHWTVHQAWGWGTQDSERALELLRRFGSVTVLNGPIHQVMQKVEGYAIFHATRSTAFPQGVPGVAPTAGPMRDVAPGEVARDLIGVTKVNYVERNTIPAITDETLG